MKEYSSTIKFFFLPLPDNIIALSIYRILITSNYLYKKNDKRSLGKILLIFFFVNILKQLAKI